jgi:GTP diphosphokinase / guanosine-3',5'-bis(diphosphate) 3'-diphosphatase
MSEINFKVLEDQLKTYLPSTSIQDIKKAFSFADKAHAGQLRLSKEPYITHPLEVGLILAKLKQGPACICAAFLHDTIEDCNISIQDLTNNFGEDVAIIVDGVTKLGKISFHSKEEEQAENFRKMFMSMTKDIRVIIIKLADRLHNMKTLKYKQKNKQLLIAKETREIFSPIAHRLGMWTMKWELEDLAFFYLENNKFQEIKNLVASSRTERESYVSNIIKSIKDILTKNNIPAAVHGRPKHFYSIYKKLQKQQIPFSELYDTLAVRIITNTIKDCYEILGNIHSKYKPISGRIKDYIAVPKSNGYQSLHTTVIGPEGKPVEIQIRTNEMHQVAELGIAAHWQYKEGSKPSKSDLDFAWLRQIIELQTEYQTPKDFLKDLKTDLFTDEVFVFTPNGDILVLAKGATPIDFAYKVHTEIGHRCIGAKANNHIVPLHYQLKSGDRIDILTSKQPNAKVGWLTFAKTSHTRSKIKQWLRKQKAGENILKGKESLEKTLITSSYPPKEVLTSENLTELIKKYNIKTYEDLYLLIGQGEVSTKEIISFLNNKYKQVKEHDLNTQLKTKILSPKRKKKASTAIKVLGESNVMVRIAKCCNPLPGDNIIGFVTLGTGVSIHRSNCSHIRNISDDNKQRIVNVEWDSENKCIGYSAILEIEAFDRIGLLQDIIAQITETKTNMLNLKSKSHKNTGLVKIKIELEIQTSKQLNVVKTAIRRISDIYSIHRINCR